MLERLWTRKMLSPGDLAPVRDNTQVVGTFNPGVAAWKEGVVAVVRVVEEVTETRDGSYASPRMEADGSMAIDWLNAKDCDTSDPRLYVNRHDGSLRLRFISHLKVLFSSDGQTFDSFDGPAIMPQGDYETFGIEDPRITCINGMYYITYVAVSPHGVVTCLLSTTDFVSFRRHGIIFCPDNKDVVLFPEKIVGNYVAMHRPIPAMKFGTPRIWLAQSNDLIHWGAHTQLLNGDGHNSERLGGGTPPILTERGWLTLYHGNEKIAPAPDGTQQVRYTAGALLLDAQNPRKIVGHAAQPVMVPVEPFETQGFVDQVVFPTAVVEHEEQLRVYYGAADEHVGVASFDKEALLACLA